ncbi:hypothetical protein ACIGO9_16420 [Nocardia asteroides]|uniref:hypothetical protein n=1 Tax=Nocardia asteroides TaxID=1824 RepID=UPI0037CBFAA2
MSVRGDLRIIHTENRFEVGVVSDGALLRGSSLYLSQVRESIAPIDDLQDREDEIRALTEFCRGDQPYLWIRAEPWAGKSALLSIFALTPRPDVTVISFFITKVLADQADHTAFTAAILDQLAVLLPDQRALIATATTNRDGLRNELLAAAAQREAAAGRRLALVVDGLDEDTGKPPIVTLLPVRPHANLRVIIASRHGPRLAIPQRHPLADCRPYILPPSPFTEDIRAKSESELDALLEGPEQHRDLLALITAANGLRVSELTELTELAPFEIRKLLGGVSGRSFRTSSASAGLGGTENPVYALAHETLQSTSEEQLGSRHLEACIDRFHAWADRYRSLGWPTQTPDFLLRRYFAVLNRNNNLAAMAALTMDVARRERMYMYFGGDAAALSEMGTVQARICDQSDPDLLTSARIARHRDHLQSRNTNIPESLLRAHALLGHYDRAEALARGTADPWQLAERLATLAKIARRTDAIRAYRLIDHAETLTRSIIDPMQRSRTLRRVIEAVACDDPDRAETMVYSIPEPVQQAVVSISLARREAKNANGRTGRLLDHAETLASTFHEPQRASILAEIAVAASNTDPDYSNKLADDAEALTREIADPLDKVHVLFLVAKAVANFDPDRANRLIDNAETFAREMPEGHRKGLALSAVVEAMQHTDPSRAESLALEIGDSDSRDRTLAFLAEAMASTDVKHAETLVRSISTPIWRTRALSRVVNVVAAVDLDYAAVLAGEIPHRADRACTFARLARTVAGTDSDRANQLIARAESLARIISGSQREASALADIAAAVADIDPDRANLLIDRAENLTRAISDPQREAFDLANLAAAVASTAPDAAVRLIDRMLDRTRTLLKPQLGSFGIARLAEVVARTDLRRAVILVGEIRDPGHQGSALYGISEAVARRNPDHAEALVRAIADAEWRTRAVFRLVRTLARTDSDRAEALVGEIPDPNLLVAALVYVAEAVSSSDPDRAKRLIDHVEAVARNIPEWDKKTDVLSRMAIIAASTGHDRAELLIQAIADPAGQASTLARLAQSAIGTDTDRANRLIDYAETLTCEIQNPNQRVYALCDLAGVVAHLDAVRADRLIDQAESIVRKMPQSRGKSSAVAYLSETMVFRRPDRADALARGISDPWPRAETLTRMAVAVAATDPDRAETLALEIAIPDERTRALVRVATAIMQPVADCAARDCTRARAASSTPTISTAETAGKRCKRLLARAWTDPGWTTPLSALAIVDTSVLHVLAEDMLGEEE